MSGFEIIWMLVKIVFVVYSAIGSVFVFFLRDVVFQIRKNMGLVKHISLWIVGIVWTVVLWPLILVVIVGLRR